MVSIVWYQMMVRSSTDGPDCEMTMRYFMYGQGLGNLSVSFKVDAVMMDDDDDDADLFRELKGRLKSWFLWRGEISTREWFGLHINIFTHNIINIVIQFMSPLTSTANIVRFKKLIPIKPYNWSYGVDLSDGQFSERCDVDGSFFNSDAIPIFFWKG